MEVTRREMLTAASAVGVTAALAQGQVGAAVPEAALAAALLGAGSWSPSEVDRTHFDKVAQLARRTAPIAFGGFTEAYLAGWAFDSMGTRIPGHRVRGFYKDNEYSNKDKLQVTYAFSYTEGMLTQPNTNYQFLVVGCKFRGKPVGCNLRSNRTRTLAKAATDAIIYDLQHNSSFYNAGQTKATFASIPSILMKEKSFLSLMLRYLVRNQSSMNGVSFTKNTPPSTWTLEVTKQP